LTTDVSASKMTYIVSGGATINVRY